MRHSLLFALLLLLSGCNLDPEPLFDLLSGREVNVVVLSNMPLELSPHVTELRSETPIKIVGQATFVCFALKGDTALMGAKETEKMFQGLMHGAKVGVKVLLKNGETISLGEPLEAWRMYGRILERGEFSACATITQCKEQWPVGALVDKIEVSSEPMLTVKGVYWESQRDPLEKPPASTSRALSADVNPKKTCGS
jgi:hypothetical protein